MLALGLSAAVSLAAPGTALGAVPSVVTGAASGVSGDRAHVSGTVNPNDPFLGLVWYFEYGTDTGYGSSTVSVYAAAGSVDQPVGADLGSLASNTTYHYRVVAYLEGTSVPLYSGADRTFTTTVVPSVVTGAASGVSGDRAHVSGTVNPNDPFLGLVWYFEYGTDTGYGSSTVSVYAAAGSVDQPVGADLGSLASNTTYHYRVVAYLEGTSVPLYSGADRTFTTTVVPSVSTGAASGVSGDRAHVSGTVNPNDPFLGLSGTSSTGRIRATGPRR